MPLDAPLVLNWFFACTAFCSSNSSTTCHRLVDNGAAVYGSRSAVVPHTWCFTLSPSIVWDKANVDSSVVLRYIRMNTVCYWPWGRCDVFVTSFCTGFRCTHYSLGDKCMKQNIKESTRFEIYFYFHVQQSVKNLIGSHSRLGLNWGCTNSGPCWLHFVLCVALEIFSPRKKIYL
jgi:hypothetical protein